MRPNNISFKATLTTKGRITGMEHTVELKAVFYNDKYYFSRRNSQSDWFKNVLANPEVKIQYDGSIFAGTASLVTDGELRRKISRLKYSDNRSQESRVVIEVKLHE